jgi:hypothetical protein
VQRKPNAGQVRELGKFIKVVAVDNRFFAKEGRIFGYSSSLRKCKSIL